MEKYFTNLDFPEIAGVHFLKPKRYLLGAQSVVWGRDEIWTDIMHLQPHMLHVWNIYLHLP